MTENYRAVTLLWHTGARLYVQPGEGIDLSHLTPEKIRYLVELGAVEPVTPRRQRKQEENDDTVGSNQFTRLQG